MASNVTDTIGDKQNFSTPVYSSGSDSEGSVFDMTDDDNYDLTDDEENPVCDCRRPPIHSRNCIFNPRNLFQKHGGETVDATVMGAAFDKAISKSIKKRRLKVPALKVLTPVSPVPSVSDDTFMLLRKLALTLISPPDAQTTPVATVASNSLTLSGGQFFSKCTSHQPQLFLTVL